MTHYSNTNNPIDFPKLSAIDKLWGEALDQAVPNTYSSLSWTQVEKVKTVFAELIVLECADVLLKWKGEPFPFDEDLAASLIKEHFGVER
jgi:hypothetical protein